MQVIIMAAGLGSRLGELTTAIPKALIEIADRTLIDRAVAFAKAAGTTRQIVVGGFCHDDLATQLGALDPELVVVENARYKLGNLFSMQTGYAALEPGGFLLMNTDHVYPRGVAKVVEGTFSSDEITAFCDFDRQLGDDDMKVQLDDQRQVKAMAKTLPSWDAGYVGMTFIPEARREAYAKAAEATLKAQGDAVHVEQILVHLANNGAPPQIADISGHGWYEVDFPEERQQATSGVIERGLEFP